MTNQSLVSWVQVITGIALLLGLALVMLELRQAKSLTLAELVSQGYGEALEDNRAVMGEQTALALSTACFEPDQLSQEQFVIVNAYFANQVLQASRWRVLDNIADFGVPWREIAQQQLTSVLAIPLGRQWFANAALVDPEMAQIGDLVLKRAHSCETYYQQPPPTEPALANQLG